MIQKTQIICRGAPDPIRDSAGSYLQKTSPTFKYSWHSLPSNDCSIPYLIQSLVLHYLVNTEQAK